MPLVWAHSEYIKLLHSLHEGAIWDVPRQTVERYLNQKRTADFQIWTAKQRRAWLNCGKNLRVDLDGPAKVTWTLERKTESASAIDIGFNLHSITLPLNGAVPGAKIKVEVTPADCARGLKDDSFTIHVRS